MNSVEVFDVDTLQWHLMPPMNQARHDHVCTSFGAEGGALIAGGKCGMNVLNSVEVYSAAKKCWSMVKSLPVPRLVSASACLCSDGRCAVLGGWDGEKVLDTIFVYGKLPQGSEHDGADGKNVESAKPVGGSTVSPPKIRRKSSAAAATAYDESQDKGNRTAQPEHDSADWVTIDAMANPAADFSVLSDKSFGTIVIRSHEKTKEVTVEPLRVPSMSIHEQMQVAKAVAAQDDANDGQISTAKTAAGNVRGQATVGCSTVPDSDEARTALQIMRKLPRPQNVPVRLQNCVAACGLPAAAPTTER